MPLDGGIYFGAARVVARILQEFIALENGDNIDLYIDTFTHGQLYTAPSHVQRRVALFSESNEEVTTGTNVVYQKLLL